LPVLQAINDHAAGHLQQLAQDPTATVIVSQAQEVLQQTGQKILNATRAAQKQQKEGQDQEQQAEPGQSQTDLKMMEQQIKLDFIKQKGELELQIRAAKASQERALADAKMAASLKA
jgi:pantoate kinase